MKCMSSVNGSMWAGRLDQTHKDSIKAALVPGRGASTIRKKQVRESSQGPHASRNPPDPH
eukprot:1161596-Pelagomonas_calceolata.AAC.2